MYYKKTSFLVLGLLKSGYYATSFLLSQGATVYVYDKRNSDIVLKNKQELQSKGAILVDNCDGLENVCDVLVLSPGVPVDSEISIKFKSNAKRVIGELELGTLNVKKPIVAITGTNGKTTVCSLVNESLNSLGVKSVLAGNVGTPVTSIIDNINEGDVCVLEVSSYQLETTYLFCPHVSVILNVTPDHLERHYTMENYALVKSKIIMPLRESEFAVLNYDDLTVRELSLNTRAKILWFSVKEEVSGAYLKDGALYFKGEKVTSVCELPIKGLHNVQNVLASICILKSLGFEVQDISTAISLFKGVKHRLEKIATVDGVNFINDSKSTNPDSAIKAIESCENDTVLILGGYDKGLDYTELFREIKINPKIKMTVITGANSSKLLDFAVQERVENLVAVSDFENAVISAFRLASEGDDVLLSPATSSFDEFSNFEERGERFAEIVKSLQ